MKKIQYLIIILIIVFLIASYFLNKKYDFFQTEKVATRIYKQGLIDLEKSDLHNAYFNFSKISQYSNLYEGSLFNQGLIATELNDNDSAIIAYETLLEKFPNTFFKEKSIYNLALAYYNSGLKEQAFANFQMISKKFPNSNYSDASNYFLGLLYKETDKTRALSYFINYLKAAPKGRYAILSVNEINSLDITLNKEQNYIVGAALTENEMWNESINFLENADIKDAWAYLSIAHKHLNNIKLSKQIFENSIKDLTQNNNKIQHLAVDEYISTFANKNIGLQNAKQLCDTYNCKINDYILYNLIPYVSQKIKIEYYNKIYTNFPEGNYAADALFNSMFYDYTTNNYENAIIKAKKHLSMYQNKISTPATTYWLAKTYLKKGNISEANNFFDKIINKYPDTYYAYLSAMRLNKNNTPFEIKSRNKIPENALYIPLPILHANVPINYLQKIDNLIKIGDFKIFEHSDFDNEIIKSWVSYYQGNLSNSSVIAEKILAKSIVKPTFDDDIYKLIYPISYFKEINEVTDKNSEISPYLLISLIRKESRFDKNAISKTGALGLMQIMPDTGKYIANLSKIPYSKNDLFKPDYNIELGTKYYSYIKSNYHKNDLFALASYNAGPNIVNQWKAKYGVDDLEEFVEKIPYQETREYIKQIYKNYWVYNCIYNSSISK